MNDYIALLLAGSHQADLRRDMAAATADRDDRRRRGRTRRARTATIAGLANAPSQASGAAR